MKHTILLVILTLFVSMSMNSLAAQNKITLKSKEVILGSEDVPAAGLSSDTIAFWDNDKGAFRAGSIFGTDAWSPSKIAPFSFASGFNNTASGFFSTAVGSANVASGISATAFGGETEALGLYSLSGGTNTIASSYGSISLGRFNVPAGDSNTWIASDPLFALGNGSSDLERSNALTVLKNGSLILNDHEFPDSVSSFKLMMFYNSEVTSLRGGVVYDDRWSLENMGIGSLGYGRNVLASGNYSAAFNYGAAARGLASVAFGGDTFADGSCSSAFGESTTAGGICSTTFGQSTVATGKLSSAFGFATRGNAYSSFVIGRLNVGGGDSANWISTNPIFEIGNGTTNEMRSNALTVLKNGTFLVNDHILPPTATSVTNSLMFYDPTTSAFRVGTLTNSAAWGALGTNTFATGLNTSCSGINSAAFGNTTQSTGGASTSFGTNTSATNDNTIATGLSTEAVGRHSFSGGQGTIAAANSAVAFGQYNVGNGNPEVWMDTEPVLEIGNGTNTTDRSNAFTILKNGSLIMNNHEIPNSTSAGQYLAYFNSDNGSFRGGRLLQSTNWNVENTGTNSFAYGFNNLASGNSSVSLGYSSHASADYAASIGFNNNASGSFSTACGAYTEAGSAFTTVFGRYNLGTGNPESWIETDPLFEIGNGTDIANRANAFTLLKNGRSILGDQISPLEDRLTINSTSDENAFRVRVDNSTKFRIFNTGDISIGTNQTPEAKLDIRGTSQIKMNSGGSNGSQLTLHETSTTDFARLDFKNDNSETLWTLAAKPTADIVSSRFNLFLENVGNVLVVTGDEKMGIARTPIHPLHVGTNASNGNGAHVTQGGTWTNGSSRSFKENFQSINTEEILETLMGLEIQKWEYKGSDEGQHLGPIAEDFHKAFGLGSNEKYITTVDIDGVALAAVQGVAKENQSLKERIQIVENENRELRERLDRIETLLSIQKKSKANE